MNTRSVAFLLGSLLLVTCYVSGASTPAPLTFVSASGNDNDPCTRADPCRNFTRALSLTAAGGEVIALESGGYEPFTINRAVSIVATPGVQAVISAPAGDGIRVAAASSDIVILRGLAIESQGGGFAGILYSGGGQLHVEKCVINGFGARGLDAFGPMLFVKDTTIRNSAFGILTTTPAVTADGVRLEGNQFGLFATNGAKVSIHNSVASGNSQQGIVASGNGPSSFVEVNIETCVIANNGGDGVASEASGTATVRISNSIVTDISVGLHELGTGVILSRGNNTFEGNTTKDLQGAVGVYSARWVALFGARQLTRLR